MSAIISPCGQYRYALWRPGPAPTVVIMLNPSIADGRRDDPTVRRLYTFCPLGFVVLNLCALISTDPAVLARHADPVGPENDTYLRLLCGDAREVLIAWGAGASPDRAARVISMLQAGGVRLRCLGITRNGSPRHPLYVPSAQPIVDYDPAQTNGTCKLLTPC